MASADISEPYSFIPTNSAEAIAFFNAHVNGQRLLAATIVLNDNAFGNMKSAGREVSAAKFNGRDITAAKRNGVTIFG